ncbi:MAG: gliding motility lipoprotein GldH [Saprospiraceae bacterium]|nr:gliding motility lipoprotein GldH [Saprospiraceae bacterium]
MKEGTWSYRDTLDFAFEIADTNQIYDIVLVIKHTPQYPYQNLYTNIYTKFPSGERVKQLLSLDLADNSGKWLGECGRSGCQFELAIQENAFFNVQGQHVITLEQYLRTDQLKGIENISLKIVEKGAKRSKTPSEKNNK